MHNISISGVSKETILLKCDIPKKKWWHFGSQCRVYVPIGFEAVVISNCGKEDDVVHEGLEKTYSQNKLESIYFVRKGISEPGKWAVNDIPTVQENGEKCILGASGLLYISIHHSRMFVRSMGEEETTMETLTKKLFPCINKAVVVHISKAPIVNEHNSELCEQISTVLRRDLERFGVTLNEFTMPKIINRG